MFCIAVLTQDVTGDVGLGNILNVVTIVNEDQLQIMGGAILVNGELQGLTADQARVIVEMVETPPMLKLDRKDIDVIEGDTSLELLAFTVSHCLLCGLVTNFNTRCSIFSILILFVDNETLTDIKELLKATGASTEANEDGTTKATTGATEDGTTKATTGATEDRTIEATTGATEMTPEAIPVAAEVTPKASPVAAEVTPEASPVAAEVTPEVSPVATQVTPEVSARETDTNDVQKPTEIEPKVTTEASSGSVNSTPEVPQSIQSSFSQYVMIW